MEVNKKLTGVEGTTSLSGAAAPTKSAVCRHNKWHAALAIKPVGQSEAACKVPNRVTYQRPSLAGKWRGRTQTARYPHVQVT